MKLALKIIAGILGVFVLIVGGVFAFLATVDVNAYKPQIVAQVKQITGRDLVLSGDLTWEVSLTPTVGVQGVTLSNAAWSQDPTMVELGEFEIKLQLLPLLSEEIMIDRLVLKDSTIVLETNADGVGNWQFGAPEPATADTAGSQGGGTASSGETEAPAVPYIGALDILNANLVYRDGQAGTEQRVEIKNLTLQAGATDLAIDLDALYQGMVVTLDGTTAKLRDIAAGAAMPINAVLNVADATIEVTGVVAEPLAGEGISLSIAATVPDPAGLVDTAFSGQAPFLVPDLGALAVSTSLLQTGNQAFDAKSINFSYGGAELTGDVSVNLAEMSGGSDIVLKVADPAALAAALAVPADIPPLGALTLALQAASENHQEISVSKMELSWGDLGVSGAAEVELGAALPSIDGSLAVTSSNVAELASAFGAAVPALGGLDLKTAIQGENGSYTADDLTLVVGETDLAGTVSVAMNGPRPKLTADLTSKHIDITPFTAGTGPAEEATGAGGSTDAPATSDDGRVIPDTPLPLEALKAADANISLVADALTSGTIKTTDLVAKLTLDNGDLNLAPLSMKALAGDLSFDVSLDASQDVPALEIDGEVNQFDVAVIAEQVTGLQLGDYALVGGKIDFDTDLSTTGASPRALAAGLDGNIDFVMDAAVLKGIDLDPIFRGDVLGGISVGDVAAETKLNCVVMRFDAENGLLKDRGILLDTPSAALKAEGEINLATEELDLLLVPAPKDPALIAITPDIVIGGTFAKPSPGVSTESVLTGLAGLALTAVNPAALLLSAVSTGSADENGCLKALEESPDAAPAAQPQGQQAPAQAVPTPKEAIGGVLRGLLGQ